MKNPLEKNITARLIFSFSLLILTFIFFDLVALYDIRTISGLTKTIYNHPLAVSNAALASNASIAKMHRSMKDVVLFEDADRIAAAVKAVAREEVEVYRNLDIVKNRILGDRGKQFEHEARLLFDKWTPIREEVIALVRNNQRQKAAEITRGEGATHVALLEEKMLGLTRYAREKATAFMETSGRTQTRLFFTAIGFLALAVIVSTLIAWLTLTRVTSSERQLKKSQELLANAIDGAAIGMVMVLPGGRFFKVNPFFCTMIGYSEDELYQMHFQDITHPDDKDIGLRVMKNMIERKTDRGGFEKRYIQKNGSTIHTLVSTTLLRNDTDEPLYFFTQIQNITERKNAENTIRENEEKYKVLFKASSDALLLIDVETLSIIDANEKTISLYGYDYDTLLTLKAQDLSAEPEKTKTVIHKNQDTTIPKRLHRKKDGTIFPVEITANYFILNKRKINISAIRDTSELKKIEMRLNQAQKMEAIGTLAGGIAHDFNNILTAIIGFAELTALDLQKDARADDDIQEIIKAGMRAKALVKQILAFARQSDEMRRPIQVDTILAEVLRLIRSTIPSTIEIKSSLNSRARIMGSTSQLHQIFMNLFTNAAHAMDDTGGRLSVALADKTIVEDKEIAPGGLLAGDYIEIRISDTGPGITPDTMDLIFEPYFTTKLLGEGTGLGLSVVHGIVESYGGKILAKSTPGHGAEFTMYLPVVETQTHGSEPEPEQNILRGSEHILFVDDEVPIIKINRRILEDLGYRVTASTNSIEALELFSKSPKEFDLVITDMTMPRMTGDVMAKAMMKIRQDIPVILCTGFSSHITEKTVKAIGIKAFLFKPVNKTDLAGIIRKVLDKAQKEIDRA